MTWCRKVKKHVEKYWKRYVLGAAGIGALYLFSTTNCDIGCHRRSDLERALTQIEQNYKADSTLKEKVFETFKRYRGLWDKNIKEEYERLYGEKPEKPKEEQRLAPQIVEETKRYEPTNSTPGTDY